MFQTNAKLEFIDCVNQLLHEATSIFYFYRSDYPIDDELIKANIALAGALFDHFHRREIEADADENEALVREIAQSEKGEDIHVYARIMNDKIAERAQNKNNREYLLLPNVESLSLQIEELLENVVQEGYKRQKIAGINSFIHA